MNGFEDAIRAHGIRPRGAVVDDGKWHRCPTESHPRSRNGAWCLAPGGTIGWFQDWSRDQEPHTWHAERETDAPTFDPARMRAAREEARRQQQAAVLGARQFYEACAPLRGGHPYLEAHGLDMTGAFGLKVDREGWLVVPAQRRGSIMSVQRIAPDGMKRFWPGAPMKGASYMIRRQGAAMTVLCEGLATGLALYACLPLASVLVAFHTGNMSEPDVLRRIPRGMAVVAADNDHETAERIGENPGIKAAEAAAELLGCGVAVPEGIRGTDWADLRQERLAERLEKRDEDEREAGIRRAVDAEIRSAVMRHARLRNMNGG